MDKIIISVATTGGRFPTKEQNPALPHTAEEIAANAVECWRTGAAIVHIHVRDEQGRGVCEAERYQKVVDLIRAQGCDIVINLSTGGGSGVTDNEQRFAAIAIKPELCSYNPGSFNFGNRVYLNPPDFMGRMAKAMFEAGIKPEIEVFDTAHIYNTLRVAEKGFFAKPYYFQFVLGVQGGALATPKQLIHYLESVPQGSPWSVAAIGRHQLPLNVMAIAMGGHARTGLEDNVYYGRGELAKSNAQLVERLVRIARDCGREPATPGEAREILQLSGSRGKSLP